VRTLLALLLLAAPAAAQAPPAAPAVVLRPMVVVEDQVLRLGDLFEGAGAAANQPLGAAPAPGRRMILEAAQLYALARAHGLVWRPLAANERSVIERPGRAMPREEIDSLLRAELLRLGLDPEAELDLGGFQPPLVPPGSAVQLGLEGAAFDLQALRFAATLVVIADGMPTTRVRLAGRAVTTQPVVLATRRMAVGEVVGPADLRPARLRAERVRPGAAERSDQVLGQQLRRPIGVGLPFTTADLGAPVIVERNTTVLMVLEAPGIQLTAQGRALEAGSRGGVVSVLNPSSNSVVEARVIGPGRVRVTAGAQPSTPTGANP
jgi:flagella basal body P-ring formation protein FlgA